ncbi:hypothetical protein [Pseudomonas sp. Z18(2022)]|uniref:hypothetical protein n=1 Tax=Pseudomonas sp. Z18(2022) TaxID=2983410 RepID=UPI002E81FA42|nr:hypothetical protein [Pseudomonas sp. Z18(2022)]
MSAALLVSHGAVLSGLFANCFALCEQTSDPSDRAKEKNPQQQRSEHFQHGDTDMHEWYRPNGEQQHGCYVKTTFTLPTSRRYTTASVSTKAAEAA